MSRSINAFFERDPSSLVAYKWPNNAKGLNQEQTIELKARLAEEWKQSDPNSKLKLAHKIVYEWGGVRRNQPETLKRYVERADMAAPPLPLAGIASYSKIFTIADPERYVIYDARVAAALNAVQLLHYDAGGHYICFNYVPGRNVTINGENGFVKRFSRQRLIAMGWQPVRRDDTYQTYLTLLKTLSKKRGEPLHSFEMTLFANAVELCRQAMQLEQASIRTSH